MLIRLILLDAKSSSSVHSLRDITSQLTIAHYSYTCHILIQYLVWKVHICAAILLLCAPAEAPARGETTALGHLA